MDKMKTLLTITAATILTACAEAPLKPPYNPDQSRGPCRVAVNRIEGKWVAVIDRNGGDGYASGSFGAHLKVFVSGAFGKSNQQSIPLDLFVRPDETEVQLTGPDGFTIDGGAPGSCEAFAAKTT